MRFNSWRKLGLMLSVLAIIVVAMSFFTTYVKAQTEQPQTVVLRGLLVDMTCAVNARVNTGTWTNLYGDHKVYGDHGVYGDQKVEVDPARPELDEIIVKKVEDGTIVKGCAVMCMTGGQPAALFADNEIKAAIACSPRGTEEAFYYVGRYVASPVELEGYWAAGGPESKVFVPVRIRRTTLGVESRFVGTGWRDLNCGNRHE